MGCLCPRVPGSRGQLEEERNKGTVAEERQKELTVSWLKERDALKKELTDAKQAKEKAERDLRTTKNARDTMVRSAGVLGRGDTGVQGSPELMGKAAEMSDRWCVLRLSSADMTGERKREYVNSGGKGP